jgi:uncharacterized protein (DUF1800 family)
MSAAWRAAEEALGPFRPGVDGPWDDAAAAHLLRRACFGGTRSERGRVRELGPAGAVQDLVACPPIDADYERTLEALAPLLPVNSVEVFRSVWLTRMLRDPRPFREQLALFWHGHFATSLAKVHGPHLMAAQVDLFRALGPGPFGALLAAVARDPAMIRWLDGNTNRARHSNENFARELLELFCLGVGHYTERDVLEAARAFSGWHEQDGRFRFDAHEHDGGDKRVLGAAGALDGDDVLAACLARPACAEHVGGRLFRHFVHGEPSAELVAIVGARYREGGYDTLALLRELLASREFFGARARRALVASPVALAVGAARTLGLRPDCHALGARLADLGQALYAPPSVKGWDGGRAWLNAATLIGRMNLAAQLGAALARPSQPAEELLHDGTPDAGALLDLLLDGAVPDAVRARLASAGLPLPRLVHVVLSLPEAQLA